MNTSYVTKSGIDSTLAIILGASSWPYCAKRFSKCESFQKSSEGVRRYLKSRKGLGVPPEKVLYLFNRRISHSGILKAIAEFIDNQSKVIPNDDHTKPLNIIIYYTGHGIVTPGTSQLFLTHIDSREDDLYHSSIAISSLAKTLRDRRGLFRRYIILDCCFAGEAFKDLQADGLELFRKKLEESFPDKGTALLASCGNNEVSKHVGPPDSPFTMFSWGLLTVLREGDSQYDEYLSLKQLCDLIQARLRSEFHDEAVIPITHTPEKADGDIALMPLFPNAHKEKNGSKRTKVVKEFAGEEAEEALEIFSYYIRQVVCYNQGELPQYSLLANELHREVKKCYTARQKDIGSIREACDKLQGYLNRNLFIICDKNFDLLKQYFRDRHHIEPRICVKEHIEKGRDRKKIIFVGDIRRDTDINHPINYPTEYTLGSNSGFLLVKEYGKACQFNNIPEMIESGVYYNARINSERAKEYWNKRKKAGPADTKKNEDGSDSEWVECWYKPQDKQGNTLSLDPKSCYKSTLITPMTLWYNDLDISFKRLMAVRGESIERLILGYLCIDHVQENYFKRKDEDIGYIFADILSLYQFVRLIYTKYSPYFSASYTLLKKQRAPGSVKTKKT